MTIRAIGGLAGLNLFFLVVGAGVLWGLRGWRWWTDLVRLGGLAYLLGVASFTIVSTVLLVVGVPFGWPAIAASGAAVTGAGLLLGWRRGNVRPVLHAPGFRLPRLTIFGALMTAALAVYFEALFRSGRLAGMSEWDAWRCWTLRGKAIFYFNGLDRDVFDSAACPGYPPGFSTLEASAFHAMGSVDVVTVHLQYWFLALGFVAALAGLLAPRVRQAILLPFLLLLLVLPSFTDRVTDGRADLPLAYLLVLGAVLIVLWLDDRHAWRLPAAAILFAGVLLTKREGLLLMAFVIAAALVATWREKRRAWPGVLVTGLAAFALALPWRLWLAVEDLSTGAPPDGYLGFAEHVDRAWPSLKLVVRTLFDYDLWLLAAPLALAAATLAFIGGARRTAVFATAFTGFSVLGCTWVIWSEPEFEITQDYGLNPVVRLVGGSTLVLVALTPLLLEQALGRRREGPHLEAAAVGRRARILRNAALPWAIVFAAALAYPMSMLVGYSGLRLPGGAPEFPSADECMAAPVDGARVRVVLAYVETYAEAAATRGRARDRGFGSTEVAQDGCGRLRVFIDDVASEAVGRRVASRALAEGFRPTVENDPGD